MLLPNSPQAPWSNYFSDFFPLQICFTSPRTSYTYSYTVCVHLEYTYENIFEIHQYEIFSIIFLRFIHVISYICCFLIVTEKYTSIYWLSYLPIDILVVSSLRPLWIKLLWTLLNSHWRHMCSSWENTYARTY